MENVSIMPELTDKELIQDERWGGHCVRQHGRRAISDRHVGTPNIPCAAVLGGVGGHSSAADAELPRDRV